jgi:hypothetical protein
MNLVKIISDQISRDTLDKISSTLGVDSETLESAVSAAVPSMLAGLGRLASQEDGVRKLSTALGNLDDTMFGNFDRLLNGGTGLLMEKGSALLGGLFGDGLTNSLATAVSRFSGLNIDLVKKLLAALTPLVLGRVASQWRNQGGTAGALKSLFAGQQRNIEDALPSGFNLEDVPGLTRIGDVRRAAPHAAAAAPAAEKSLVSSLLPLALLIAGALMLWFYFNNRERAREAEVKPALDDAETIVALKPIAPETAGIPSADAMRQELTDVFQSLGTELAAVKDAASAQVALPKLEQLDRRIDALKTTTASLPAAGRTALSAFVNEQIETLAKQAERVLTLAGLPEQIKTIVREIVRKLSDMRTTTAPA